MVREELAAALGFIMPPTTSAPFEPQHLPVQTSTSESFLPQYSEPSPIFADDEDSLAAKLRDLVNTGAPWQVVSEVCWQRFNSRPTPQKAAQFLEMAFVQASPDEMLQIFTHILSSGLKDFYWYLHPKLRDFLVEHSPERNLDQIYWIIARERDESKLSGLEQMYLFLRVATTSDKTAAWTYFQRNQNRILESFAKSTHFGMNKQHLILRVGELALGLGHIEDAGILFDRLPAGSPEKNASTQFLSRFKNKTTSQTQDKQTIFMDSAETWQERLALISEYCGACHLAGGVKETKQPALDSLLKSILQWVPKNADAWRGVGDLIIRHRKLEALLPNLYKPLLDQAIIFNAPDIDEALWSAALNIQPSNTKEKYLKGSALLHKYISAPSLGEKILWDAHAALEDLEASSSSGPWTWNDLIQAATQWTNQSSVLAGRDRKRVLAALKIATDGVRSNQEAIATYHSLCTDLPAKILNAAANKAATSNNPQFATALLIRAGYSKSFTNQDLFHLWSVAGNQVTPDLAWRIATVLAARDALPVSIKSSWEISGEHRSAYAPIPVSRMELDCALSQLSPPAQRLCLALCALGQKINEFVILQGENTPTMPSLTGTSTIEQSIANAVKNSPDLPKSTKTVAEASGIHMTPPTASPLAQAIINTPWVYATRIIAERLSLPSWAWSLAVLQDQTKSIIPLIGKSPSWRSTPKLAKWLGSMTSNERMAWLAIVNCTNEETPESLSNDLVKFVCRLAVILYPSHLASLKSIQQIRMPLDIIRDMEWFILSDALTALRIHHKIGARVTIPQSLRREIL
jgi:hypothetical protein